MPCRTPADWEVTDVEASRQGDLKTRFDVEDLADRIATAAIAATFRRERGTHEAKGAWRPTFAIEVTPQLFDRFFNNPCGYRGHYLASPDLGVSANLNLLKTIAPRLLTVAPNSAPGRQHIEESLASPAAKIWIDEDQHDPRNPELRVQVQVPTWVAAATAAHARLQSADPTLTPKQERGQVLQ